MSKLLEVEDKFKAKFDGVARLFNLFLERDDWPKDSVYHRIVSFRDKLESRDYNFSETEKSFIPLIGLMVVTYGQAVIQDTSNELSKQALIDDLLEFEDFLNIDKIIVRPSFNFPRVLH